MALLFIVFSLYNFTVFNKAESINQSLEDVSIMLVNEPEIINDQSTQEGTAPREEGIDVEEGGIISTEEGTVMIEEGIHTDSIIDNEEFLSGVLTELSGEMLYDTSGSVIGEIIVSSGNIIPVDLNGTSLLPQPLQVIYPLQAIVLDASGYVVLDSLFSVMTTGGDAGASYCSRIAYENLSSILKAGVRTRRETNDFIVQGDADQLVQKGLADKTIIEVTKEQLQNIFSGTRDASVYDLYVSFMDFETRVYHRIAVVFADDSDASGRYILDPLRGARTIAPQKISDYLAYYEDEIGVQRYVGQGYVPLTIKESITQYNDITQLMDMSVSENILTGDTILSSGSTELLSGEVETTGEILVEELFTGIVPENTDVITGSIQSKGIVQENPEIMTGVEDEIVTGYFDRSYDKGVHSEKIIKLQKLLAWLKLYTGPLDGIYSEAVIEAVYQYQLQNDLLKSNGNNKAVRGYLGPKTRKALNDEYVKYQLAKIAEWAESRGSLCDKKDIACRKQELQQTLVAKGYTLTTKGLVKMSKEALIGSEVLDMSEIRGELIIPIVLQSKNTLSGEIAEVQIPQDTIILTENGKIFTGEVPAPLFLDTQELDAKRSDDVIAAIDVGPEQKIQFVNPEGQPMYATFRVPAPGMNLGDTVDVRYSQDGEEWRYLTAVEVQLIDGEPYAIFEADHFTQFYLGTELGSFTINNDAPYTTGLIVTLNSSVSGATHMRFGNSIAERNGANWIGYSATHTWTLSGADGDGIKRVYAQFSGNGVIRNVSDSIIYDSLTGSLANGLRAWYDASTTGTNLFRDIGPLGYDVTRYNSMTTGNYNGEEVMVLNGSNQYAQYTNGISIRPSAFPFSISARVRPGRLGVNQAIVIYGSSNSTTVYDGIYLRSTNTLAAISRYGGTIRYAEWTTPITLGQRYHIVVVFNSQTQRSIYVNGVLRATNVLSAGTTAFATPHMRIGRMNATSTSYFSGMIDEVRFYNRALGDSEIANLYINRPKFDEQIAFTGTPILYGTRMEPKLVDLKVTISGMALDTTRVGAPTGKWMTVPYSTPFANGVYDVILTYKNIYDHIGSGMFTGALTINTSGIQIQYSPSTWTSGNVLAILTGLDPTYMIVNNFGSEFYTFTGNGSFAWQYVDKQGTTGTSIATVTWIDKTSPVFTGVVSGAVYSGVLTGGIYQGNVRIDFFDENLSGATLNGQPYVSGTVITGEGLYVFRVVDLAGNSTGATFEIKFSSDQKMHNQLIGLGYLIGRTGLQTFHEEYYIGTGNITLSGYKGQLLLPIALQSVNTRSGYKAEVEIPRWTVAKWENEDPYEDILQTPVFIDPSSYANVLGRMPYSAIQVGNTNRHIIFMDIIDDKTYITYRIPVPGSNAGDLVDIYMGPDSTPSNLSYVKTVRTVLINGAPYVIFDAGYMSVVVTAPNNGLQISADKAQNSSQGAGFTILGNIVISEVLNNDFAPNQVNTTLILTPPPNWQFRPGYGGINYTSNRDIQGATMSVTSGAITIYLYTDNNPNRRDELIISNIQVQAITGNIIPASGNILRTCVNPGTATIAGIVCDVTNFGSLSQTFGVARNMMITLSGQTFVPGSGNSGLALSQIATIPFTIPFITVVDQFKNIVLSYSGNKTLMWTGATGTFTTGVHFSGGQSTTSLVTTLLNPATGVTLTVTDGIITGLVSSPFDVLPLSTLNISGPVSFDFGEREVSDQMQSIEVVCTGMNDYFKVIDEIGADTGYYTTLQISAMVNTGGDSISFTNIAVKSFGDIVTLAGTPNPRVYSAITGIYQYFSGPLTFIKRDTGPNSSVKGTYGLHTVRKVDIPALQNVGMYTGVITYTLY